MTGNDFTLFLLGSCFGYNLKQVALPEVTEHSGPNIPGSTA